MPPSRLTSFYDLTILLATSQTPQPFFPSVRSKVHVYHSLNLPCREYAELVLPKNASSGERTIHSCVPRPVCPRVWLFVLSVGPFLLQGFYAKPAKAADGTLNLMEWDVGIPGKQNVS